MVVGTALVIESSRIVTVYAGRMGRVHALDPDLALDLALERYYYL